MDAVITTMTTPKNTSASLPKPNGITLSDIDPKKDGKFSPLLFRFLKRQSSQETFSQLWKDGDGIFYIGWFDDTNAFVGARLGVVISDPRAKTWCYEGMKLKLVKNFWRDYLRIGRCAIDPDHDIAFLGERWDTKKTVRTCLWCGHKQRLLVSYVRVRKEDWVNVA